MKGLIARTMIGGCMLVAVLIVGCHQSPRRQDPCWPERYNALARNAVSQPIMAQASNGHILDQTIWNWMFTTNEKGDPQLNADGHKHLVYLLRRRPAPDAKIFLQTAHDIPYDAANPDRFIEYRSGLDNARIEVVQRFLSAYSAGRQMAVPFTVVVHDPAPVGATSRQTADVMNARGELFKLPTKSYVPDIGQFSGGGGGGGGGGSGSGSSN